MAEPARKRCTAEDYWSLPDGVRAEIIDGELYDMALPSLTHQKLVVGLVEMFAHHIRERGGTCTVLTALFAVNLNADDSTYVEPDVLVVCDPAKLSEHACVGAPDLVVEVVSPSSRRRDYLTKAALYAEAGVREYWIVDPETQQTAIYYYEQGDVTPTFFGFAQPLVSAMLPDISVTMARLLG